jgi:inorganic triphosphatase YgiF
MARLEDHSEVELKLTVVGDDPDGLLDAVATLDRLGEYELGPVRRHRLRDVYWDTPEKRLREHGLTIRLRRMDPSSVSWRCRATCWSTCPCCARLARGPCR